MSANPAGDTAISRPLSAAPGAPSTTRGPTVGVAPTTARAEQDLVDQGYGEAGREFVDRALELTRLVGGTVAILVNTQWQTGAANSIRLRHPAFEASVC
jgi:hypothetical protein